MFKRIGLFLATNIAIIAVISIILKVFNVQPYLTPHGLDYSALLIFSAIVGFVGSFTSLLMSKFMAKYAYSIQPIHSPSNEQERWLMAKVQHLADRAGVGMPEVGIYDSPEPNAFATGWNRNNALVAVSTGLMQVMDRDEIEGVLGHEMSHVANGDMVTLTLIQGVVNTFVIFFARIAAYVVTQFLSRGEQGESESVGGLAYFVTSIVFQIIFGILASMIVMWFSRLREFRADAGSARLVGQDKMVRALQKLHMVSNMPQDERAPAMATMKISSQSRLMTLFASHPPIEARIQALQNTRQ